MKYKNLFVVVALAIFIVPQIAFAAWWNPFTWNWTSFFNAPSQTQTQDTNVDTHDNVSVPTAPVVQTTQKTTAKSTQKSTAPSQVKAPVSVQAPAIPVQTNTTVITDTNIDAENSSRQNALNVYNQILNNYLSLDTYITSAINSMNNSGVNTDMTSQSITWFTTRQNTVRQVIDLAKSQLSKLQSEPLSYFLTYSISTDTSQPFTALNAYPDAEQITVNTYNQWLNAAKQATAPNPQLTALQNQASQVQAQLNSCLSNMSSPVGEGNAAITAQSQASQCNAYSQQLQIIYNGERSIQGQSLVPITVTQLPSPVSCTVQSPGIGGGQGSITCHGGTTQATVCTFTSPGIGGGQGQISCH